MVINKFGDRLYNGLVETETAHLRGIAARVEAAQATPLTLLNELSKGSKQFTSENRGRWCFGVADMIGVCGVSGLAKKRAS